MVANLKTINNVYIYFGKHQSPTIQGLLNDSHAQYLPNILSKFFTSDERTSLVVNHMNVIHQCCATAVFSASSVANKDIFNLLKIYSLAIFVNKPAGQSRRPISDKVNLKQAFIALFNGGNQSF